MSKHIKDIKGWRDATWGMNEFEILSLFDAEIARLPERKEQLDGQYVDFSILGYEIGGDKYDVDFYMDSKTEGLAKVSIRAYYILETDEEDEELSDDEDDDEYDEDEEENEVEPFYKTEEDYAAEFKLRSRFGTLERLLKEKYGKPSAAEDNSSKPGEIFSLIPGPVEIKERKWVFPSTIITLGLVITNDTKSVWLDYASAEHQDYAKI